MQRYSKDKHEFNDQYELVKRLARSNKFYGVEDHEDVAQNAMLKLLNRENSQKPTKKWLYLVVKSCCTDVYRRSVRESQRTVDFEESSDFEEKVSPRFGYSSLKKSLFEIESDATIELERIFKLLPQRHRDILQLFAEGYSYAEMAQMMNLNIGTVRSPSMSMMSETLYAKRFPYS